MAFQGSRPGCLSAGAEAGMQRVGLLAGLPSLVMELGGNPWEMAAAASLDLRDLANPENRISFVAMGKLFEAARTLTGVAHIGLLLGQRTDTVQALGLVGELMQAAPRLGAALDDLATHQRRYVEGSVISLIKAGGDAFLGYTVHQSTVPGIDQIIDAALMAGVNLTRKLAGVLPAEVHLARAAPANPELYFRIMRVPVRFDAPRSFLILPKSDLDRPVLSRDAARRATLEKKVEDYWAVSRSNIVTEATRVLLPRTAWGDDSLRKRHGN